MPLRGKAPEDRKQRLKLLLSGEAGVGKTTAAIQMPKPYIIDTEQGSVHYGDMIEQAEGAVFEAGRFDDVIAEVRALMTEPHDYLTLVIDPITNIFNDLLDEGERRVGTDFGRHYGYANRQFKRLCNLLSTIDMNVVITAHEKNEYGEKLEIVGKTFDGYKKLDYVFDLWLQLERNRKNGNRVATVRKTRLAEFPDQERFEWSYETIKQRYGQDRLEKGVQRFELATPDQVERFRYLLSQLNEEEVRRLRIDKALATVEDVADLPAERIRKGIELIEHYKAVQIAA
ncbi:MAG: AAA family ATPase [Phycisphaeraceae bacterium]